MLGLAKNEGCRNLVCVGVASQTLRMAHESIRRALATIWGGALARDGHDRRNLILDLFHQLLVGTMLRRVRVKFYTTPF